MPRNPVLVASLQLLCLVMDSTFGAVMPSPPKSRDPKTRRWILAPQSASCSDTNSSQSAPTKWISVQQKTSSSAESKPFCMMCLVHPDHHQEDTCERIQRLFLLDGRGALFVAMTLDWPIHELKALHLIIRYETCIYYPDNRIWSIATMFLQWYKTLSNETNSALQFIAETKARYTKQQLEDCGQVFATCEPKQEIACAAPSAIPDTWNCAVCTFANLPIRDCCDICATARNPGNNWQCEGCGFLNSHELPFCEKCG